MKLNIHKKVLTLVLGTGLATFLVLGLFSYVSKSIVQRDMAKMSAELGEKSANYTDEVLTKELEQTLGELAKAKAEFINREMAITREDATILAQAMTNIISHPENYSPRTQPDPRTQSVKNGQTYLIFAPEIRDKVTPELMQEISIAANISDLLEEMTRAYSDYNCTAFAGSAKGWYFCSRIVLDANGKVNFNENIPFSHERIYDFDPRKRPWYEKAVAAQKPVVSDLYMTLSGVGERSYQQIGASAPFYDAAGNFAGVVGLDYSNEDIYAWINEKSFAKSDLNFVLNEENEILFSSGNENKKFFNKATQAVIKDKSGVVQITIEGKDFYVAFAPMPDINWTFCMVVSEDEILMSTESTHNYFLQQIKKLQDKMNQEYSYMNGIFIVIPLALLIILFVMSTKLSRRFV